MPIKKFVVVNPRTGQVFTIEGKSLKHALITNGLNPTMWQLVHVAKPEKEASRGNSQGDGRPKNN